MPTPKIKKTEDKLPTVTIQNARLIYKNFSGKITPFNKTGQRKFNVVLDPDTARDMERFGWNIKWPKPREDGEERNPTIEVEARYTNIPPKIVLVTSRGQTLLDENTIHILDWSEIKNVDLVLNPSSWEVNGNKGVKAYLKKMYVEIVEDELDKKYRHVPDAALPLEEDDGD